MGYERAKWHSGLTYRQICEECKTEVTYQDNKLGFRFWFPDGFVYCPNCKRPLRHSEDYAIDRPQAEPEVTAAPVVDPVAAPVAAPVVEPVVAPVAAPVVEPVAAPVAAPVVEPVVAPVAAPVVEPVVAPVAAPVVEPVVAPVAAPVVEPVATPVAAPVAEPVAKAEEPTVFRAKFCFACGTPFDEGQRFCIECGAKRI